MSEISASYQPNKIKRKGYTSWIDESNQFCTTTAGTTLDQVIGQNLMDAFDVDWSAYLIDNKPASATSIINKLNTPATAINNFLGVLEDSDELLREQDRSTKGGSYWIVGDDIDIIIGEKTYKQLHAGDQVIINVGAHDWDIVDAQGFEECYYCVQINMSGYLPLIGGTMTGSIDFEWDGSDVHNMLTWRELGILQLDDTNQSKLYFGTAAQLPLTVHELTSESDICAKRFIKPGSNDNYVLLAGGGTKALSEIMPDGYKMARWDEAVSWGNHALAGYVTSSGITRLFVGTGLLGQRENGDDVEEITSSIGTISLKTASNDEIGGISIGYTKQSDNQYPIELNSKGQAYVTVPWTDTDTNTAHSHTAGEGLTCSGTGGTSGTVTYTLKTAATGVLGGIKLGYTKNDKNYPVELNTEGQAYVNVPWTDTPSTDEKVKQTSLTNAGEYPLLCKYNTGSDSVTNSVNFVSEITVNPSTGAVNAQAFYETSDIRKKEIKSDLSLDKCYELIDKCQTVIYSLKDQTKEQVGMIAQEIEEFFPEVVATDEEGFKSLAYDRLVVICFKVLKDVIKRLEKLES